MSEAQEAICTKADLWTGSGPRPWGMDPCPEGCEEYQSICCHACPKTTCLYRCNVSKSFDTCIYTNLHVYRELPRVDKVT